MTILKILEVGRSVDGRGRIGKGGGTHVNKIPWRTRLRTNSPQILPISSKGRNAKLKRSTEIKTDDEDDVVLLRGAEAGTLQGSTPDSLEQHGVDVAVLSIVLNTLL